MHYGYTLRKKSSTTAEKSVEVEPATLRREMVILILHLFHSQEKCSLILGAFLDQLYPTDYNLENKDPD